MISLRDKRFLSVPLALASMMLVASCAGGSSNDSASPQEPSETDNGQEQAADSVDVPEKTELVFGTQPFAETAIMHIAIQEGFFEEEGLSVSLAEASGGGGGLVPGLVSGDIDVIYSNYVSVLQAAQEGLPLRVIRENDRPGVQGIYASAASGITEPADLAGKRIGINGLGNIMELTSRAVLDSYGVTDMQFVEIPPPNMLAAIAEGQVDAAWLVEPFVTLGTSGESPVVRIVSAFEGPTADLAVAGWIINDSFREENPNTVVSVVRALDKAAALALADRDVVDEILPTFTALSPELVPSLAPLAFAESSDFTMLQQFNELMVQFELLDGPVDVASLVADVPGRK